MSTPAVSIVSGYFPAPAGANLTPSGKAKKSEVNNPYLSADEYLDTPEAIGTGITTSSAIYTSGQLDKIILRASSYINRYCRRWFDTQTIDELQTGFTVKPFNPRLVNVTTRNSPIQSISSIYIQVLKFFIQIETDPNTSYIQIMPDWGVFKIVPLLSSAGSGANVPVPAAILDKVPLGILWYNYTFGFGQPITDFGLTEVTPATSHKIYQASDYNYRLWSPDQTTNVYVNSILQASTAYTIDYPNGKVTFNSALQPTDAVTADFTTNNTIPSDIKEACIKLVTKYIIDGLQNPGGFSSLSITGYSVGFGKNEDRMEEINDILMPYRRNQIVII